MKLSADLRSVAESARPGIALDFDGTLSEVAPTPQAAVIHPRCATALRLVLREYPIVAVVSGRAARDVASKVGERDAVYVGSHGAEWMEGGIVREAAPPPAQLDAAVARLREELDAPGIIVEHKRFSASVHYRLANNQAAARRRIERALADIPLDGLETFWGRMLLEIRPARAPTKGDAIAALAEERSLDALLFIGDDTTDIDAMRRLRALPDIAAVGVAVASPETPPALIEAARCAVNGVPRVAELLELMAAARRESKIA